MTIHLWFGHKHPHIPVDIITNLKAQAATESDCPLGYLKLFTPDGNATYWIPEWHEEGPRFSCSGCATWGWASPNWAMSA